MLKDERARNAVKDPMKGEAIGGFASLPDNQGSDTRRGTGIAILNIVGQCGPLLGNNTFPKGESPYDQKGVWVSAAFTLCTGFLALCLRTLLVWENKKLDEKYGPKADLHAAEGVDLPMQKTAVGEDYSGSRPQTMRSRRVVMAVADD
ncbi:MAG: hypothetical protein Q9185_001325 [Variospora sp. 1 TL-2023]